MTGKNPLQPGRFPLAVDGKIIVDKKGKTVATAESEPEAVEIARRLNESEYNKEEDRWSA